MSTPDVPADPDPSVPPPPAPPPAALGYGQAQGYGQQPSTPPPPGYGPPQGYGPPPGYGPPQGYGPPAPAFGQYAAAYGGGAAGAKPDTNLVWGILTTLFCCLPAGIVSIVFAAKVDGLWNSGDYAGARKASKDARTWALVSLGATLVVVAGFVVIGVVGAASGTSYHQ